jgi:23S rRNA (uridine2552-2'-O)-methyltransferase
MATYRPHDRYFRKARERGLPSRAAFKLEELLERFQLALPGARVVDLGCAPGGWLAVLSRAVGHQGRVVGVDLAACKISLDNVSTIVADISAESTWEVVKALLDKPADLLTSDLAPKLTGIAEHDQARMAALLNVALEMADAILRPGGAMVAKIFMGSEFERILADFKHRFRKVNVVHVRASRPGSAELYAVARGRIARGPRRSAQNTYER